MKKILVFLYLLSGFTAVAQIKSYTNEFLNIGAGAKALAMGGAQVASSSDGYSGYWNPAGLTKLKGNTILSAQHAEYFSGIGKYDFVSLVKPLNDKNATIGASFMRFAVDNIANTLFLVNPDGSIDYNNVTSFSSADYAVLLSFAKQIKKTKGVDNKGVDKEGKEEKERKEKIFNIGGNAKIIHRKVGTFAKAWGIGFDLGLQMEMGKWGFGAMLRDATSTVSAWSFSFTDREQQVFYSTNNEIPTQNSEIALPRIATGFFRDFQLDEKLRLRSEANVDITFDGKRNTLLAAGPVSFDPRIGAELVFAETISLRTGFANFQKALSDNDLNGNRKVWVFQPSLGIGAKYREVKFDYAFVNLANQSKPLYTHVISLSLNLVKRAQEEEE
jgi:hypothetical protein